MENPILRGYTEKKQPLVTTESHWFSAKVVIISLVLGAILAFFVCGCREPVYADMVIPNNLYMGLIAEDTSGNYQTYLVIASVVRNRLNAGMNNGLVALKRKNLQQFVKQNCDYVLKTKGLDLTLLATKAITEVWQGKDFAGGATHYEHTKVYPVPKWAKNMKLVKVIYPNTKQEISLWRER